jgi:mono/diheme cytochrome c family protein
MHRSNIQCYFSFVLLCSFLLFGCSRKNEPAQTVSGKVDSVSAKDSSSVAADTVNAIQLSYEQRQGKTIFTKYCSVCHGLEGKGDGFNSFNLDPKPKDLTDGHYMNTLTDDRLAQTIREGGRSVNRSSLMPSWGGRLTKDEILYVVAYVRMLATHSK